MIKSSFWSHCWGEDGGGGTIEVKEEEEIDDENVRIFHKRDDKVFFSQLFFLFSLHIYTLTINIIFRASLHPLNQHHVHNSTSSDFAEFFFFCFCFFFFIDAIEKFHCCLVNFSLSLSLFHDECEFFFYQNDNEKNV